jgi:hypothetical protein
MPYISSHQGLHRKLVILVSLISLLLTQFYHPVSALGKLEVRIVGTFDGKSSSEFVSGTITSSSESISDIFTFEASCLDRTTCGPSPVADWFFGDGTSVLDAGLKITHRYQTPGKYRVKVVVKSSQGTGSSHLSSLVSSKFADLNLSSDASNNIRSDRFILWGAAALGFFDSCGPALPATTSNLDSTSYKVNRALICPEPTISPLMTSVPQMPANSQFNGVNGLDCLEAYYNCGLPKKYFTTKNPDIACDDECIGKLQTDNFIDNQNRLIYDPLNCSDGWTAKRIGVINSSWSISAGVEEGCLKRGDFIKAIANSIPNLDENNLFSCSDAQSGDYVSAAKKLFSIGIDVRRTYSNGLYCEFDDSITKGEAYAYIPTFTNPSVCESNLRDLENRTLGYGLNLLPPNCGKIISTLDKIYPIVGDTECADRIGKCFNQYERLTRAMGAELLISATSFKQSQLPGVKVGLSASSNPIPVGGTTRIIASIDLPASLKTTDSITAIWSDGSPNVSQRNCSAQTTQSIGNDYFISFSCNYTRQSAGSSAITITLTLPSGKSSTHTYILNTEDEAPRVGSVSFIENNEGENANFVIPITNSLNSPLTASLRSFDDFDNDPGVYPATGVRAGSGWLNSIPISTGTLAISQLGVDNIALALTANNDAYGVWRAVGRVCGPTLCTIFFLEGETFPVNDQPLPGPTQSISAIFESSINIKLSGTDPNDIERFSYPSLDAIELYRIDSLPSDGELMIDSDPGSQETWVPASVGVTTNNNFVKYKYPPQGDTESEGYIPPPLLRTFTYSVKDIGYPTPGKWSVSEQILLFLSSS